MREMNQAGFARRVGYTAAARRNPCNRRDVDNSPHFVSTQFWRKCPGKQERSAKIGLKDAVPNFDCELFQVAERNANVPSGIVDEDVEPSELSQDLPDAGVDGIRIALVQLYNKASPTRLPQRTRCRARTLLITDIGNGNIHASFCESPGYSAPNVARASSDESSFSGEIHEQPRYR